MKLKFAKLLILFIAAIVAIGSWFYTYFLVDRISEKERERIKLWAEAYNEIQMTDINQNISPLILTIIQSNTDIPVILCDQDDNIIGYANIDSVKLAKDSTYLEHELDKMRLQHDPIVIDLYDTEQYFIYYEDSKLLSQLYYYPIIQLAISIIFFIVIYIAIQSTQKAEENRLWVALSKETAHQLGTPLSSLMAWVEYMKLSGEKEKLISEVEKDVKRLETITERFSKIGSKPELQYHNLTNVINESLEYLKKRVSKKIEFVQDYDTEKEIPVMLNKPLFEWVIENLSKNSVDAMNGQGTITIRVKENGNNVIIDLSDTGSGIPKRNLKQIFRPGYTTKKHGWGMGLTLVKRIIETYHKGKIYVAQSEPGKGTTFRIILAKYKNG